MTLPRSGFLTGGGGSGSSEVGGPGSSTDNALARFDGATGKLIQNSVGILTDAGALSGITMNANVITSGTLLHELGGLEANVSAYNGLVKISGGATSAVALPLTHENGGLESDVSAYSGLLKISGGATSQAADGTDYYNDAPPTDYPIVTSGDVYTFHDLYSLGGGVSTGVFDTADTIWLFPVGAGRGGTLARVRFQINAKGAGNPDVRINCYRSDGTRFQPGTRILGSDTVVSVTATGVYSAVLNATIPPGLFWLSMSHDTATSSLTWRTRPYNDVVSYDAAHTTALSAAYSQSGASSIYGAHPASLTYARIAIPDTTLFVRELQFSWSA